MSGVLSRTGRRWSPLDRLRDVAAAVSVPVAAVGGMTVEAAAGTPDHGASIVILATPLTVPAGSSAAGPYPWGKV